MREYAKRMPEETTVRHRQAYPNMGVLKLHRGKKEQTNGSSSPPPKQKAWEKKKKKQLKPKFHSWRNQDPGLAGLEPALALPHPFTRT